MKKILVFALGAALSASTLPTLAGATELFRSGTPMMIQGIRSVHALALDDGTKGFIGSDHKLYLLGPTGKYALAKAGHYMLAQGGCVTVGADAAVDPASFSRLSGMRE